MQLLLQEPLICPFHVLQQLQVVLALPFSYEQQQ